MPAPLKMETHHYQAVRTHLLAAWPELDAETLNDTLEGITNLHEMIAAVIRSALVDEALQAGLRTRLEDMKERLTRLEERGAKKRQLALDAMHEVGLATLQHPGCSRYVRRAQRHPRDLRVTTDLGLDDRVCRKW